MEAGSPLASVGVEVLVAAVTCDEHDGRRDLLGVSDEPGSRHPVPDAGSTRLSSDVMVEVGHDSTGAFLDHRLQGVADIVADISLNGLLRRFRSLIDDLSGLVDDLANDVRGGLLTVIRDRCVAAGLGQWAHLGGAQGDAVVEVPSGALGNPGGIGGLDNVLRAVLHPRDHVDEGGVDRLRNGSPHTNGAVVPVVLIADLRRVAVGSEGVAFQPGAQAETMPHPSHSRIGLEGGRRRARSASPVTSVGNVVVTTVNGQHTTGLDVDRGESRMKILRPLGACVATCDPLVLLAGRNRCLLVVAIEGGRHLEPATLDLLV